MIDVSFRRRTFGVAEGWDELEPWQFLAILRVASSDMPDIKRQLAVLRILLRMPWWLFRFIKGDQLHDIMHLVSWIDSDTTITRQLVPVIRSSKILYGPADNYDNLRVAEFHFADMYYQGWKEQQNFDDLCRFVAVLYRPRNKKKYASDPRSDFKQELIDDMTADIKKKVPMATMQGIVICYERWRERLETSHPRLFTKSNKKKAADYGWFPVFRSIAAKGIYGDMNNVEQMYLNTLFLELEILKDEEIELKRKHPKLFKLS